MIILLSPLSMSYKRYAMTLSGDFPCQICQKTLMCIFGNEHSLQCLYCECLQHSLQQICQMQNHFIIPPMSSHSQGRCHQANPSAASLCIKERDVVFIDLTSSDLTTQTDQHEMEKRHSGRLSSSIPSLQKSKCIEKRRHIKNKHIDQANKLASRETEQSSISVEKQQMMTVYTQMKGKQAQWMCERFCFEGGMSMKMKFWLTSKQEESEVRSQKRTTRTQVRNDQSGELNLMMELDDKEVKVRHNVAKYRYNIPECSQIISTLCSSVSHKLHFGMKTATVLPVPIIERGGFNHKILVGCLKMHLGKRRFIDLLE